MKMSKDVKDQQKQKYLNTSSNDRTELCWQPNPIFPQIPFSLLLSFIPSVLTLNWRSKMNNNVDYQCFRTTTLPNLTTVPHWSFYRKISYNLLLIDAFCNITCSNAAYLAYNVCKLTFYTLALHFHTLVTWPRTPHASFELYALLTGRKHIWVERYGMSKLWSSWELILNAKK